MNVYEFVNLLSDDGETISIWDYAKEEEVYKGSARDAVDDYGDYEILGIDLIPKFCKVEETIVLNIESEEEEE